MNFKTNKEGFKNNQKDLFYFDSSFTFTNHGGLGRVPKKILEKKHQLEIMLESSPDVWFRDTSYKLWLESRQSLANYLNIDINNLVFCKNSTDGINSIIKSVAFKDKEIILATEYTYGPILNAIDYVSQYRLEKNSRIPVVKFPIKFPIVSVDTLLCEFDKFCGDIMNKDGYKIKLTIIDHISSAIATVFPVEKMIRIMRKWSNDAIIVIDGAHAIGQIDIGLDKLDCDFYVSSLHKWFLSPRGCAFLYFKDLRLTDGLEPNYVSYGYKKSVFLNFKQRASDDMIPSFLVTDCIRFYEEELGGLKIVNKYCTVMIESAVNILVDGWKTSVLSIPKSMEAPFMRVVKLPKMKILNIDCQKLTNYILENYKLMVYIVEIENDYYVRICCFIYNELTDYVRLKDVILDLKDRDLNL